MEFGRKPLATQAAVMAAVGFVYFVVGKASLSFASINASASPVWPPSGISIAALVIFGYRMWPAILVGAFLFNMATAGTPATSLAIAVGNTLEGLAGAWATNRFAGGRFGLRTPLQVGLFALLACGVAPLSSATIGVVALAWAGLAPWPMFGSIWATWYLGDVAGALVVAPLLLLWTQPSAARWSRRRAWEAGAVAASALVVGGVVFSIPLPVAYAAIPVLLWAALRLGPRETVTAGSILNGIAVVATVRGLGPFQSPDANESLLVLQGFVAVVTVVALFLAVVVDQRRRAEAALRRGAEELEAQVALRTTELNASRARFAAFMKDMPGLAWVKDARGAYVFCNEAFAATIGRTPADVVGRRDVDLFPPEIAAEYEANDDVVRSTRKALPVTERQIVGSQERISLVHKFPLSYEPGGHDLVGGVAIDITHRSLAEERFRGLLESAPDAMVIVDQAGIIVLVNGQAEKLFGYDRADMVGKPIELLIPDRFRERHPRHREGFFENPKARPMGVGLELFGRKKDGSEVPVEISLSPLKTPEGMLVSSAIRDVTERKRAHAALVASEARLAEAQRIGRIGSWEWDVVANVVTWSDELHRIFDVPKGARIDFEAYLSYLWPEDRPAVEKTVGQAFQAGEAFETMHRVRWKDGSMHWVHGRGAVERGADGKPLKMWGTAQDVTEERAAEQQRLLLKTLKAENEFKSQFINMAAHELNTPLTPLKLQVHLLKQAMTPETPEANRKAMAILDRNLDRVEVLVRNMLDVGRIQSGKIELRKEPMDLNDALIQCVESFEESARIGGVTLERWTAGELWLDADPLRISQVLYNLMSNAVKFTRPGGRVLAEAGTRGDHAVIRVRDTGVGLTAEQAALLFQPFRQLHEGAQTVGRPGTGLGLYITRELVRLHGGDINVESPGPGLGATFTVTIPGLLPLPGGAKGLADARPSAARSATAERDSPSAGKALARRSDAARQARRAVGDRKE